MCASVQGARTIPLLCRDPVDRSVGPARRRPARSPGHRRQTHGRGPLGALHAPDPVPRTAASMPPRDPLLPTPLSSRQRPPKQQRARRVQDRDPLFRDIGGSAVHYPSTRASHPGWPSLVRMARSPLKNRAPSRTSSSGQHEAIKSSPLGCVTPTDIHHHSFPPSHALADPSTPLAPRNDQRARVAHRNCYHDGHAWQATREACRQAAWGWAMRTGAEHPPKHAYDCGCRALPKNGIGPCRRGSRQCDARGCDSRGRSESGRLSPISPAQRASRRQVR